MVDPASAHSPAPFIVGVGRSGTTLLRLMLDAHPQLAIPTETHFLLGLIPPASDSITRDEFFHVLTEAATWPNLALDAATFNTALRDVRPFSVADGVRAFFRLYAQQFGKVRWGDKTPPYRGNMIGLQALLPEAHFIHIIRDGRDVALSYRGLWFGPGDDIEAQARFWVGEVLAARRQAAALRHYLEIRYETLVAEPEATLQSICSYLKLPYEPQMLEYHKIAATRLAEFKRPFGPPGITPTDIERFVAIHAHTQQPPDPGRIDRWRTEMTAAERQRYREIGGTLLHELGYDPDS
jgi:hypothetical protein